MPTLIHMYTYKKISAYYGHVSLFTKQRPIASFANFGRHWPGSFLGENVTVF